MFTRFLIKKEFLLMKHIKPIQNYKFMSQKSFHDNEVDSTNKKPQFKLNPNRKKSPSKTKSEFIQDKLKLYYTSTLKMCEFQNFKQTCLLATPSAWILAMYNHNQDFLSMGSVWIDFINLFVLTSLFKGCFVPPFFLFKSFSSPPDLPENLNETKPEYFDMKVTLDDNTKLSQLDISAICAITIPVTMVYLYLTNFDFLINECEPHMVLAIIAAYVSTCFPRYLQLLIKYPLIFYTCLVGLSIVQQPFEWGSFCGLGSVFVSLGFIQEIFNKLAKEEVKDIKKIPFRNYILLFGLLSIVFYGLHSIETTDKTRTLNLCNVATLGVMLSSVLHLISIVKSNSSLARNNNVLFVNCSIILLALLINQCIKNSEKTSKVYVDECL